MADILPFLRVVQTNILFFRKSNTFTFSYRALKVQKEGEGEIWFLCGAIWALHYTWYRPWYVSYCRSTWCDSWPIICKMIELFVFREAQKNRLNENEEPQIKSNLLSTENSIGSINPRASRIKEFVKKYNINLSQKLTQKTPLLVFFFEFYIYVNFFVLIRNYFCLFSKLMDFCKCGVEC